MNIIDILLKKMVISQGQLEEARREVQKTGVAIEKALTRLRFVTDEDIARTLANESGVPYMDLGGYIIDPEVIKLVPEAVAKKFKVIPLFRIGESLTVAMADPLNIVAIDEIRKKTGFSTVEPVSSMEKDIESAIEQYYGVSGSLEEIVKDVARLERVTVEEVETEKLEEIADEVPVIRLVNMLIMDAVKRRSSDIHIEPEKEFVRVRYRIDGILHEASRLPKNLQGAVISRIKVLSKMDIAEQRRPQDNRFLMKMENAEIDLRVSTFPTINGENVVIRLLNKLTASFRLTELGMSEDVSEKYEGLIRQPHGIILVTGPTGCGKTTTLYASLITINSIEKNIITIEDPIEYELPLIRQTQVNPKAGVTFSTGLRNIVRQDPDIIMVGEIRDKETADIAIQAALTGHLVFSTLHTNDASGALTRLIDMDVEPFLISSTVIGILAQRLVRVICEECKEKYKASDEILKGLSIAEDMNFFHGRGCIKCNNTGFRGRIGIFELLLLDEQIKKAVVKKPSSDELHKIATAQGMVVLYQDGLRKVKNGITTIEEVLRVTKEK